jgi:hypothetical protein
VRTFSHRLKERCLLALVGKKRPRKILSPMDFGDAATRRKYRRSGLVITYMKGEIPTEASITFDEFLKIEDKVEAQTVMRQLVADNSDARLAEHWGVPLHRIKTLRSDLGLIKDRTGELIEIKEPEKWGKTRRPRKTVVPMDREAKAAIQQEEQQAVNSNQFQVVLRGTFSVDELSSRLEALCAMLPAVSGNFSVDIQLKEDR